MIQVATVFGSNLSAQPFRLAAYRSRLLSSGHFVYILRVCRLHYSTAHNHFIIVAPNLKVLYNSPHPEIQPHGATSVFEMLFYMLICYHQTLSSS